MGKRELGSITKSIWKDGQSVVRKLFTTLLVGCFATGIAYSQGQRPLMRHTREVVANGQAALTGRLPASQTMRLVLVLPLRNQAELDSFLRDLYDPSSTSYRKFLTVEEFADRFGPSQGDYAGV